MNPRNDKHSNCENLEIPLCQRFYKRVSFPNQVNEKSQWEAAISLYRMLPITRVGCSRSRDFKRLLCMTYMPPCTSPLLPSWVTLCKKVKSDCGPFLAKFGVTWPWQLQCEKSQVETFQKANLKMISVNTSGKIKKKTCTLEKLFTILTLGTFRDIAYDQRCQLSHILREIYAFSLDLPLSRILQKSPALAV